MKPRQFRQLSGQSGARYFSLMAEGLSAIAENCQTLDDSAETLASAKRWRGAQVLRTVADEEAGKFLILLDALRLGRGNQRRLRVQLARAGDHLSKGLYCRASEIRPADFAELEGYLEDQRATLYLDGPNDVDWVFRNQIFANREELLYVDLVESESGIDWLTPARYDAVQMSSTPSAVRLVSCLAALGCGNPAGLPLVTDVWQGFSPEPDTRWPEVRSRIRDTIGRFDAAGLLDADFGTHHARIIIESWTFPLHSTDLRRIEVTADELRERRQAILGRLSEERDGSHPRSEG